jgi:hypothetical protein
MTQLMGRAVTVDIIPQRNGSPFLLFLATNYEKGNILFRSHLSQYIPIYRITSNAVVGGRRGGIKIRNQIVVTQVFLFPVFGSKSRE